MTTDEHRAEGQRGGQRGAGGDEPATDHTERSEVDADRGSPDSPGTPVERAAAMLLDVDESAVDKLPVEIADEVPGNAAKQVTALALQKAGDLVVDPRTVLSWVLTSVGAPSAVVGLLVPVRESGSMLPQTFLAPIVRRQAVRKWFWVAGAAGQCLAVAAMAVLTATTEGALAGWGILAALAVFALARSLSSLTSKDVLGRTIPKGARGQVTGMATVASGAVAITLGAALRLFGGEDAQVGTLALLLGAGALAWAAAGTVFAAIKETPSAAADVDADGAAPGATADPHSNRGGDGEGGGNGARGEETDGAPMLSLLRHDAPFRRFVIARTLLLVSALSPPFVVALATEQGSAGLQGLGPFLISSGVAALIGGRFWGRLADRSSRLTMMLAAGAASSVIVLLLAVLRIDGLAEIELLYPAAYLLLALAHTGARVGRKTYIVDLGEGDARTNYVAASNSAIGVLLLVTGGLSAAIATLGVEIALAALALLGLVGVLVSRTLREVSTGS